MSTLLEERPVTRDPEVTVRVVTEPTRHGGRGGGRRIGGGNVMQTAGFAAIALAILLVVGAITGLVDLGGIFGGGTTTTSSKVLLKEVRNLSSYTAIEGAYQEDVTIKSSPTFLPDFIDGQSTTLRAVGTVPVNVDFSVLATDAVQVGSDGSVSITLPAAELGKVAIDQHQSKIINRDRGLVPRIGDAFESDPVNDAPLYTKAEKRIAKAARQSHLIHRAKKNTETMLTGFLSQLGFQDVTITWTEPPAKPGPAKK